MIRWREPSLLLVLAASALCPDCTDSTTVPASDVLADTKAIVDLGRETAGDAARDLIAQDSPLPDRAHDSLVGPCPQQFTEAKSCPVNCTWHSKYGPVGSGGPPFYCAKPCTTDAECTNLAGSSNGYGCSAANKICVGKCSAGQDCSLLGPAFCGSGGLCDSLLPLPDSGAGG